MIISFPTPESKRRKKKRPEGGELNPSVIQGCMLSYIFANMSSASILKHSESGVRTIEPPKVGTTYTLLSVHDPDERLPSSDNLA